MKYWICALVVCGCGLFSAQAAEIQQTHSHGWEVSLPALEAGSPVSIGLGGPGMALAESGDANILSAGWGELQDGCLVPESGAFASLISFVRGAAIRAQAAHEKEALLRMTSLCILMLFLGLTAAICLEPERRRLSGPF